MKRKKLVLAVSAAVFLGGYTVGIFGQTEGDLTQKQIDNPNTLENKEEIARSVLESTGRSEQYDLRDLGDVTVYLGSDVTGNPQDAIVTVSFGPKNTVVAAYTADGNVYEYTGDLGDFYGVQNIRFVPVPELKKEIVIVREQVNQSLGSFEQSDILRGYVFDGKEYQDVLNTPQKIESSWNNLWNKGELQEPSLWRRVTEETESKWTGGEEPSLTITRYQSYLESDDKGEGEVPADDTFQEKDSRVVVERFFWSDEWNRFILDEAVEVATGQPVAIIENLASSPYLLADLPDFKDYRIVRKDGTTAYVDAEELKF